MGNTHTHAMLYALLAGLATSPGHAQVRGDFNNDGEGDLAIGIPEADVGGHTEAGAVLVLYGTSANGLTAAGVEEWDQDDSGMPGWGAAFEDHFGAALAVGDFDGDGYDDLAVSSPNEDAGATNDGAVTVLYGRSTGLSASGSDFFYEDSISASGSNSEDNDQLGISLATGDLDGDGYDDLVVGQPYEDVGSRTDAGAIIVLFGSSSGLGSAGSVRLHQDSSGIRGGAEAGDYFGIAVTTGDYDGDGYDDVGIGISGEDVSGVTGCGAVGVIYGSSAGLSTTDQFWSRVNASMAGTAGAGDGLGIAVCSGDFDGDGYDDLAAGAPSDDVGGATNAGSVNVMFGSSGGLLATNDEIWHQNRSGVLGTCEDYDYFGRAIAAGDFDGDGRDDLAVGVHCEDRGTDTDAGVVNVLYGTSSGMGTSGNQLWDQDEPGVAGGREAYDRFGRTLAVGNFNGDSYDDLAIGVPWEEIGTAARAGAVNVIYGSYGNGLDVNDVIDDQMWHRNDVGIPGAPSSYESLGDALASSP